MGICEDGVKLGSSLIEKMEGEKLGDMEGKAEDKGSVGGDVEGVEEVSELDKRGVLSSPRMNLCALPWPNSPVPFSKSWAELSLAS